MFDVVCMYSSQSEESVQLVNEVDRGKQVMVTYEQSMTRKDQIINSLTRALAKQVRERERERERERGRERSRFGESLVLQ